MTPAEIRDLYVETLANAFGQEETGNDWRQHGGEEVLERAGRAVDALASAGLLPTSVEGRYIGRGMLRRTRLVTDWKEPEQ
ncbi:hypothetical protein [Nocardia sp. NPDC019255]|uniref:hypothetical protein n=1 Tax=Nocardia sp. NPDC019255 TaxID=3154591 RepID=UPI0033EE335E